MKLTITSCIALLCFANIECGTIKNLMGTAAKEINEIAGAIEEAVSKATDKLKDSDASRNVGNSTGRSVSTDVIVSDIDSKEMGQTEHDRKIHNVNIEINLVVNYQTDPNKVNVYISPSDGKDQVFDEDVAKHQTGAVNAHTEISTKRTNNASGIDIVTESGFTQYNKKGSIERVTYQYGGSGDPVIISNKKDDASGVDRITGNGFEQTNEVEITTAGAVLTNPNIVFPGPSSNVKRNDSGFAAVEVKNDVTTISKSSGAVTEKIEIATRVDPVLFPDSAVNRTKEAASCPTGLVMTEKGDCLMPIDGANNRKNGITRMLFVVGCIEGYARALDGSCQKMIYD